MSLCVYRQWAFLVRVERRQDLACSPSAGCWETPGLSGFAESTVGFSPCPESPAGRASLESSSGSPVWLPAARVATLSPGNKLLFVWRKRKPCESVTERLLRTLARRRTREAWLPLEPPRWASGWPRGRPRLHRWSQSCHKEGREIRGRISGRQGGHGESVDVGLNCLQEGKNYSKWTNSEI